MPVDWYALADRTARATIDALPAGLRSGVSEIAITLEQRTKGESDIAVAAASVLARERFVDWMEKTSAACGIRLPLGAGEAVTDAARELVRQRGPEALGKAAKLHFRTTAAVLGGGGPEPAENG